MKQVKFTKHIKRQVTKLYNEGNIKNNIYDIITKKYGIPKHEIIKYLNLYIKSYCPPVGQKWCNNCECYHKASPEIFGVRSLRKDGKGYRFHSRCKTTIALGLKNRYLIDKKYRDKKILRSQNRRKNLKALGIRTQKLVKDMTEEEYKIFYEKGREYRRRFKERKKLNLVGKK